MTIRGEPRLSASSSHGVAVVSVVSGALGFALLPVMFPDVGFVLGVVALVTGLFGVLGPQPRSRRSRVLALAGMTLGLVLLAVVAVSVVFGQAHVAGGGPAPL